MAVLGARARPELLPTTRRWFLSAARRCAARAAGYLTRQMSRWCLRDVSCLRPPRPNRTGDPPPL